MRPIGCVVGEGQGQKRSGADTEGDRGAEIRGMPQQAEAGDNSVINWYAAHVIMYVEFKDGNQDHYPIWENIYLVKAGTDDAAFTKAESIGREHEGDSEGTFRWENRAARWRFAGVRKLTTCENSDNQPADGTEVTYLQYKISSRSDLDHLLKSEEMRIVLDEEFDKDVCVEQSVLAPEGK